MGDFDTLYGNLAEDSQRRGTQFERVCKWFLENDPVYRDELKTVWLWKDWPGRWGADAGIDLVAEDRNGDLWAIQAKAYNPRYRVSKKDVDKFLAESGRKVFSYRMLIATTDLIDRIGERTIQQQEKRSCFFRLNDLRSASVDWPASPDLLLPVKRRKPATPRPHQKEAIRDVLKGFTTSDRGQLIMACGTGKTLTGLFIAEKLAAQRTLVLLPSLSLLKQTLNEWRANCAVDFASLPVCSDETVAGTDDAAIVHTADLGVPVTTDPRQIAAFLRRRSRPLVVFATYQSSPQLAAAFGLGRVPGFDLIIADEAHRVAGPVSSDFATVLDSAAIRGDRRLFMTATPRYFTGRVVKAAQQADFEVASMDDPVKFGPVFHRLSFGEAIERDLLTDYQVAIVGVDDATYRKWAEKGTLVTRDGKRIDSAATLSGQIGLAKAMRKYDLRRVISFHSRVKRAREFATSMPEVIDWMPPRQRPTGTLWSDVATGEMPAGDRYVLLQRLGRLDGADRGLLANARCLSEGVDVPTLDGVAFIDPRRSEVDIVQAVGRAIRRSEAKTVGTIVIPVFVDTAEDPEVALDSSAFKPVWDVIKALRAHDEELAAQLDDLRRQMGRNGGKPRLPDKIHFDVPNTVGADFAGAFDPILVENVTAPWEFWFGMLEQYVALTGDARVPTSYSVGEHNLGSWANVQRYKRATLSEERRTRLESLPGWAWDLREQLWSDGFAALTRFVAREGHALVPTNHVEGGIPLGGWVNTQRDFRSKGKLTADRIAKLESVPGWSWGHNDARWAQSYAALKKYVDRTGDIRIPNGCVEGGVNLYSWVSEQRAQRNSLSLARRAQLEELPGWLWEVKSGSWERNLGLLREFVAREGHANVPYRHVEQRVGLGQWVKAQRSLKAELSDDRRASLESVPGWTWNTSRDQAWDRHLRLLRAFVEREGHARVPFNHTEQVVPLGKWASQQRRRRDSMPAARRADLESMPGWTWDLRDSWGENLGLLRAFAQREGHARVNRRHWEGGVDLGSWVAAQRLHRARLSADQQAQLEAVPGWTWDPRSDDWQRSYEALRSYAEREGRARPPVGWIENGVNIYTWVQVQRRRGDRIDDRRRQLLQALPGWTWRVR